MILTEMDNVGGDDEEKEEENESVLKMRIHRIRKSKRREERKTSVWDSWMNDDNAYGARSDDEEEKED